MTSSCGSAEGIATCFEVRESVPQCRLGEREMRKLTSANWVDWKGQSQKMIKRVWVKSLGGKVEAVRRRSSSCFAGPEAGSSPKCRGAGLVGREVASSRGRGQDRGYARSRLSRGGR